MQMASSISIRNLKNRRLFINPCSQATNEATSKKEDQQNSVCPRENSRNRYFSHRHDLPIIAEVACGDSKVRMNKRDECLPSSRGALEGTRVLCFSGVEATFYSTASAHLIPRFPISRNFFVDLSQHSK